MQNGGVGKEANLAQMSHCYVSERQWFYKNYEGLEFGKFPVHFGALKTGKLSYSLRAKLHIADS